MYKGLDLRFEYVIRFPGNTYYTDNPCDGLVYGKKNEAMTYTEKGAYAKIEVMKKTSPFWNDAVVERV